MRTVKISEGPEFRIESTGNGLFMTLIHRPTGKSVFFQGDDAHTFTAALYDAERAFPTFSPDQISMHLWSDCEYGSIATHTKVTPWGPYCRMGDKRTFVPCGNVPAIL